MKFHNTLVNLTVTMAKQAKRKDVVLTGGCFQNKYLLEHGIERLEQEGFNVFWPQEVPANDGGLSLGQILVACGRIASGEN
jgi:hydrogenase maturation protein HypF